MHIHNLTHSLLQQGDAIRQRGFGAPSSAVKNITTVTTTSVCSDGKKVRSDSKWQPFIPSIAHGHGQTHTGTPRTPTSAVGTRGLYRQQEAFRRQKRQQSCRSHQSVPVIVKKGFSYCVSTIEYKYCPGLKTNQTRTSKRPYKTFYRCEECSMKKGECVWLCDTTKKIDGEQRVVTCHLNYHSEKIKETTGTSTTSSVDSDLTEES